MNEKLLAAILTAPFVITMVGFAVAIAFAPAVPNEIAPATEHDHEEMDHVYSSSRQIAVEPRGRFAKPKAKGKSK
ncbi:MAG: hypothetical protein ACREC0_09380 [Methylocella sp.]